MRYQRWIAPIFLMLLFTSAQAQRRGIGGATSGSVHVHIVFDNDRAAGPNLYVQLMEGSSNTPIANTFTDSNGQAYFSAVRVGDYHIVVSGDGIKTTESRTFEVDERKVTQSQYIPVQPVEDSGPKPVGSHAATISAAELNVSPKARKELDKANDAMAQHDWKKAKEHLQKAIAVDPRYALAYNNLGVFYARTDDPVKEREALEKAISLDDHFVAAYVNLAKLCFREKNFSQAETLLEKSASAEPNNPENLMLLADAQYMDRHYDAAIASAHQAHASSSTHPAFVHYIAARAYDKENRRTEALAELEVFLKEEPTGPRADSVRAAIQSQQRQAQ